LSSFGETKVPLRRKTSHQPETEHKPVQFPNLPPQENENKRISLPRMKYCPHKDKNLLLEKKQISQISQRKEQISKIVNEPTKWEPDKILSKRTIFKIETFAFFTSWFGQMMISTIFRKNLEEKSKLSLSSKIKGKQNGFKWIENKGSKGPKPSSRQLRL